MTVEDRPRVLIVDDSKTNRAVLVWLYSQRGYRCDVAMSGSGALSALARERYDLISTDLDLGDGFEGAETVRRLREAAPITPITAVYTDSSPALLRELENQQVEMVNRAHLRDHLLEMVPGFSVEDRVRRVVGSALDERLIVLFRQAGMLTPDGNPDLEAAGRRLAAMSRRWRAWSEMSDQVRKRAVTMAAVAIIAIVLWMGQWIYGHAIIDLGSVTRDAKGLGGAGR